jgi:hypothetical protein
MHRRLSRKNNVATVIDIGGVSLKYSSRQVNFAGTGDRVLPHRKANIRRSGGGENLDHSAYSEAH